MSVAGVDGLCDGRRLVAWCVCSLSLTLAHMAGQLLTTAHVGLHCGVCLLDHLGGVGDLILGALRGYLVGEHALHLVLTADLFHVDVLVLGLVDHGTLLWSGSRGDTAWLVLIRVAK